MFGKNERIVAELASLERELTTNEQTNVNVLSCKSTFSSMCSCSSTRKHHVLQRIKSNNTSFLSIELTCASMQHKSNTIFQENEKRKIGLVKFALK